MGNVNILSTNPCKVIDIWYHTPSYACQPHEVQLRSGLFHKYLPISHVISLNDNYYQRYRFFTPISPLRLWRRARIQARRNHPPVIAKPEDKNTRMQTTKANTVSWSHKKQTITRDAIVDIMVERSNSWIRRTCRQQKYTATRLIWIVIALIINLRDSPRSIISATRNCLSALILRLIDRYQRDSGAWLLQLKSTWLCSSHIVKPPSLYLKLHGRGSDSSKDFNTWHTRAHTRSISKHYWHDFTIIHNLNSSPTTIRTAYLVFSSRIHSHSQEIGSGV